MTSLKRFQDQFSVQKLYNDLDYWIFIGIGSDIVDMPIGRMEYQHLVKQNKFKAYEWVNGQVSSVIPNDNIPNSVLADLAKELKLPWYKRPTFWHLVKLNIKRIILWK